MEGRGKRKGGEERGNGKEKLGLWGSGDVRVGWMVGDWGWKWGNGDEELGVREWGWGNGDEETGMKKWKWR